MEKIHEAPASPEGNETPAIYKKRSRGWVLTVNNWTLEDYVSVSGLYYAYGARYVIIGEEVGEQGTPHLQCYAYFPNKITGSKIAYQCPRAHIEYQRGTKLEALVYCMKDLKYEEFGERPMQGKRSDLDAIKFDLLKKRNINEVSLEYFKHWCQYRRAFEEFIKMHRPEQQHELYLYVDDSYEQTTFTYTANLWHPDVELIYPANIYKWLNQHQKIAVPYADWMETYLESWKEKFTLHLVYEMGL